MPIVQWTQPTLFLENCKKKKKKKKKKRKINDDRCLFMIIARMTSHVHDNLIAEFRGYFLC